MPQTGPIGIFDSGYGGLTILRQMRETLPEYDYLYLGDNARAPYGTRSFEVVYQYTLQAVHCLFRYGCPLVILGCNTASAKALRTIQQHDLPQMNPALRVLGIIRPTVECIGQITQTRHVGIVATPGTVRSHTYELEIAKLWPDVVLSTQACPMWVPLVENDRASSPGADYFIQESLLDLLAQDSLIDTLILGCTHYPLLLPKIRQFLPPHIRILSQGLYVAHSLQDYLQRHSEMKHRISRGSTCCFLTTEQPDIFSQNATLFLDTPIQARHITL